MKNKIIGTEKCIKKMLKAGIKQMEVMHCIRVADNSTPILIISPETYKKLFGAGLKPVEKKD
jgi:hypothetical protein